MSEKGVEMLDAVITKTAKGAYMAQGNDGKGNKLTTLMNGEKALAAIAAGVVLFVFIPLVARLTQEKKTVSMNAVNMNEIGDDNQIGNIEDGLLKHE